MTRASISSSVSSASKSGAAGTANCFAMASAVSGLTSQIAAKTPRSEKLRTKLRPQAPVPTTATLVFNSVILPCSSPWLKKILDFFHDHSLLFFGDFRAHGQRQHLITGALASGEIPRGVSQILERLLQVQRRRVVNLRWDPLESKVLLELVPLIHADRVLVIDVVTLRRRDWCLHKGAQLVLAEKPIIAPGVAATLLCP